MLLQGKCKPENRSWNFLVEDTKLKVITHNHTFVCTLIVTCMSGKHTHEIEPDKGVTKTCHVNCIGELQQPRHHGRLKSNMKIQHYYIHFYTHLMLQMLGLGHTALDTILGMLGIASHAGLTSCWAKIQNLIGTSKQKWADTVQEHNLNAEISMLCESGVDPVVHDGKTIWSLTCSFDMGWQKHAARIYNSPSGHAFLIGTLTGKIICRTVYCKGCSSCEKKWKKDGISKEAATKDEQPGKLPFIKKDHCCPCNYNGTLKSMEARSVLSMVTKIFEGGKANISNLVSDDDLTHHSNLKHSPQAILDADPTLKKKDIWPKNNKGHYIADNGKLPLSVHAIDRFLADPLHRAKSFGRALYVLFRGEGKKTSFTNVDHKHLKQNHGFWQCQNCLDPFDVFKACSTAVVEHHYGNHEWCNWYNQ